MLAEELWVASVMRRAVTDGLVLAGRWGDAGAVVAIVDLLVVNVVPWPSQSAPAVLSVMMAMLASLPGKWWVCFGDVRYS